METIKHESRANVNWEEFENKLIDSTDFNTEEKPKERIKQERNQRDFDDAENISNKNTYTQSEAIFKGFIANVDNILKVNADSLIPVHFRKKELDYTQQSDESEKYFQEFKDANNETESLIMSRNTVWFETEIGNCDIYKNNSSAGKFQLNEESKLKQKDLQGEKLRKCNMCDYHTSYNGTLNRHIKSAHLKIRDFKCDACNFMTTRNASLKYHIDQVHLKIKNHACHLCEYRSYQKKHLESHMKSVHLKQRDYKCEMCEYCTARKNHLKQHVNTVHKKLKEQKCHLCNHRTTQKVHLNYHIKAVHLKLKDMKCELCDYSATKRSAVGKHMKNVHS